MPIIQLKIPRFRKRVNIIISPKWIDESKPKTKKYRLKENEMLTFKNIKWKTI